MNHTDSLQPLLITANELASMLSIGQRTLWRLLAEGKMVEPVRIGGNTRWRMDEVRTWIEAGCPTQQSSDNESGGNQRWHPSAN